jgi:hypothetical protein
MLFKISNEGLSQFLSAVLHATLSPHYSRTLLLSNVKC